MENPLVTIITPVYNHELYLEEYFESIINQSYENIELILINDASTDKSKLIINDWLERVNNRFKNVIYLDREINHGLVQNCNDGLELARGKYIYLFASDDVMFENNIKEKVLFLESNIQYAMVYGKAYHNYSLKNVELKKMDIIGKSIANEDVFDELITKGNLIVAPTVLVKAEVLKEVGGYNSNFSFEDFPLWLEIADKYKMGYLDKTLVFYRKSPNSLSRNEQSFFKMIDNHKMILNYWKKKKSLNINVALNNVNKLVCIWSYYNKRTLYREYRKNLNILDSKIFLYDLFYTIRLNNNYTEKVLHLLEKLKAVVKKNN